MKMLRELADKLKGFNPSLEIPSREEREEEEEFGFEVSILLLRFKWYSNTT